jgi:MoaA/NifB/PqqE/SkfB family radical SAM enzyme
MSKLFLPDEMNYAEMYLTLRCNFKCDYCINGDVKRKRKELTGEEWVESLNELNFRGIPITLGGGEPTLHKDFFYIVNNLENKVDLLTNLSFDVDEFINNTNPSVFSEPIKEFYHPIRVSYHVGQSNEEEIIEKTKKLIENDYNPAIFGINHPNNINDNMKMAFDCAKNNVPFYTKDFLGEIDGQKFGYYKYPDAIGQKIGYTEDGFKYNGKEVMCRSREFLVAPDGLSYKCHRDLYKGENPLGNILNIKSKHDGFNIPFRPQSSFRRCHNYGDCNPCDVKMKTNRYLGGVECQVDIIS